MWKKFDLPLRVDLFLFAFYFLFLTILYSFFPLGKLPYWMNHLILVGFSVPLLYLLSLYLHSLLAVGILVAVFLFFFPGFLSERGWFVFDFFLQWGFFFLGFSLSREKKMFSSRFRPYIGYFLLLTALTGFLLLFFNWKQAVFFGAVFSVPSFIPIENRRLSVTFLPYLLLFFLSGFWQGWESLLWEGIFLVLLFIFFQMYELFLSSRVRLSIFLFSLSFLCVIFAYGVFPISLYLIGIFAGKIFTRRQEFSLSSFSFYRFYPYLLIFFSLLRMKCSWEALWKGATIAAFLALLGVLNRKRISGGLQSRMPLELPLAFYGAVQFWNLEPFILTAVSVSLILIVFSQLGKARWFLFLGESGARPDK